MDLRGRTLRIDEGGEQEGKSGDGNKASPEGVARVGKP